MNGCRFTARIYRIALHAFPSAHRAVYADEMVHAFQCALGARRTQGVWAAVSFAAAACFDALRAGLGERRRHHHRYSPLPFIIRDLIHAVSSLARARTFSIVSILSIGIGIGTVIAFFVVVRAITGVPPGVSPEGVVELLIIPKGSLLAKAKGMIETWTYPDFVDVRDASTGLALAGWTAGESVLRLPGGSSSVDTAYVSPNYFRVLGVRLARGAGFDEPGVSGQREVIVRYDVWQTRFGADPDIIGSTIGVNGVAHVVVGVTSEDFRGHLVRQTRTMDRGGTGFEIWLPLSEHPRLMGSSNLQLNRDEDWVRIAGRLSPDTSIADAGGAVTAVMVGLAERYPDTNALKSASVEPYFPSGARQRFDTNAERVAMMAISVVVLLVVCLNMSGMVLVRTATRERELAVRLALGASRGQLMQYLLAESVVLATSGGAVGESVVFGTPRALARRLEEPMDPSLQPDTLAIAVCIGLCFVTSFIFGMLPAVRFSRPKIISALKDEAACGGGRNVGLVHRLTAAVQAGFAVPLLVVCAVMLDQVRITSTLDLGFNPAGLFYVPVDLALEKRDAVDAALLLKIARERLESAEGVAAVAVADGFPLDGDYRYARIRRDGTRVVRAETTRVSPGYLETIGARILRGRAITSEDQAVSERTVVISEPLAALLFPQSEPLGQQLELVFDDDRSQWYRIVGVTADLVSSQLETARPQLFVALSQHPASRVLMIARSADTAAAEAAMASTFEHALADFQLEEGVVRSSLETAGHRLENNRTELAMGSVVAGVGGAVALLLAALGVFGVIGFMVATRTREIGIRIALGASRSRVRSTVLFDALKLAVPGVIGGLLLAVPLVQEFSWYSLGVVEPLAYFVAAAITLGVTLLAGWPAARRAAAVEPMSAMRAEQK